MYFIMCMMQEIIKTHIIPSFNQLVFFTHTVKKGTPQIHLEKRMKNLHLVIQIKSILSLISRYVYHIFLVVPVFKYNDAKNVSKYFKEANCLVHLIHMKG